MSSASFYSPPERTGNVSWRSESAAGDFVPNKMPKYEIQLSVFLSSGAPFGHLSSFTSICYNESCAMRNG
ncbi:hypothetical protein Tcan_07257 [Toxocara canis]|uniref:Uncharacterized protein n=1 Tax=Toxocara canis TaxID=6265 RepID=A0A0B2UV40_TOXCA|nr:hypothetical protein Tcan_07257 [Toxocara canis]